MFAAFLSRPITPYSEEDYIPCLYTISEFIEDILSYTPKPKFPHNCIIYKVHELNANLDDMFASMHDVESNYGLK